MARPFLLTVATGLAALATASTGLATAAPALASSSGMSVEFPVGICIDAPKQLVFNPVNGDLMRYQLGNLLLSTPVSCTDPHRDYRVVAQVAQQGSCGPETKDVFFTRDVRVLCVVDDAPGARG